MLGLSRMWRRDLHLVTPGRVSNGYGGWLDDWDNVTLTPIPACSLQPETTREIRSGADRVIVQTGWRLITRPPVQVVVGAKDRVRVPGVGDLLIVGDAQQWDGIQPHTEISLEDIYG